MTIIDTQYEDLLREVMDSGVLKGNRTGTRAKSVFGRQLRYDLRKGFPVVTTKQVHMKSVVGELLWFLRGESNTSWLREHGITIWDEWADEDGELGPVYGVQWRSWPTPDGGHLDQIARLLDGIRSRPDSRRHIVSAWNVADLPDETLSPQENVKRGRMALAPCHAFFQFGVTEGRLSCSILQRSCDLFLGVPFNIASYALLTHMVAQQTDLEVGDLIWTGNDCHIYENHFGFAEEQLSRDVRPFPTLVLERASSINEYTIEDVSVEGYNPHPNFKGVPIAV